MIRKRRDKAPVNREAVDTAKQAKKLLQAGVAERLGVPMISLPSPYDASDEIIGHRWTDLTGSDLTADPLIDMQREMRRVVSSAAAMSVMDPRRENALAALDAAAKNHRRGDGNKIDLMRMLRDLSTSLHNSRSLSVSIDGVPVEIESVKLDRMTSDDRFYYDVSEASVIMPRVTDTANLSLCTVGEVFAAANNVLRSTQVTNEEADRMRRQINNLHAQRESIRAIATDLAAQVISLSTGDAVTDRITEAARLAVSSILQGVNSMTAMDQAIVTEIGRQEADANSESALAVTNQILSGAEPDVNDLAKLPDGRTVMMDDNFVYVDGDGNDFIAYPIDQFYYVPEKRQWESTDGELVLTWEIVRKIVETDDGAERFYRKTEPPKPEARIERPKRKIGAPRRGGSDAEG